MEFKKCERCGCFFTSNDNVCYNCLTKDRYEMSKFKDFINENNLNEINSLNYISTQTGIYQKNLNISLRYEDFNNIANQINLK